LPGDRIVEADGALITPFVERCGTSVRGDGIERGVRQIKHQTMERISDVSDRFLPQIENDVTPAHQFVGRTSTVEIQVVVVALPQL
jgi:hypothetical protein